MQLAASGTPGWLAWLLIRCSLDDGELAFYVRADPATTLTELTAVAGRRWGIEKSYQAGKNETGRDQYQVPAYTGWYRHITLAMFVHALLTVLRTRANTPTTPASPTLPTAT